MVPADVAFIIVATALVLLMTPALAFFYGGLVRSKNALNTMMMSFVSLGVLGVTWAVLGYSLAFGTGNAWIGDLSFLLLKDVGLGESGTIPHILFMAFQATFAIVTAALISGAIVERMRFGPYVAVPGAVVALRLQPGLPLGVGAVGLAVQDGRAGLRRRHGRPHQRGRLGLRRGHRARLAQGLRAAGDPPAQRPVRAPRRRPPVVRLVRLQRRQRASPRAAPTACSRARRSRS